MKNNILKLEKIQLLKDELLEVCEAWNMKTEDKVSALQICIKNFEERNAVYPGNDRPLFEVS